MGLQLNEQWQALHRRVVSGGTLSPAEQAVYDAACRELDEQETLDGNLKRLRDVRTSIAEAESQQRLLREREAELDAQIQDLEKRLDQRTLHLLGVTR